MKPEPPPPSPFDLPDERGAATVAPSRDSPPEPPRLGILHLLVLTGCVAVYLGIMQSANQRFPRISGTFSGIGTYEMAHWTLQGIGGGAALAGMVLFFARYNRAAPYPVHPGEFLLLLTGTSVVMQFSRYALMLLLTWISEDGTPRGATELWHLFGIVCFPVIAGVFVWVLVGIKSRRWRVYLWLLIAAWLIPLKGPPEPAGLVGLMLHGFLPVPMAVAVFLDHREGKRYPWTHWFGIATLAWFALTALATAAWRTLVVTVGQ